MADHQTHSCAGRLVSLNRSTVQPLQCDGRRVASGIRKRAVPGPVAIGVQGVEGDEQADLTVHGGLEKAVYAFPFEHYAAWQGWRTEAGAGDLDGVLPVGAMGENLTLQGLLETEVWVGDRLVFPDVTLRVTAPRFPCFKFNAVMGWSGAARQMVRSETCGWYLAVERTGTIAAGEEFIVQPGRRDMPLLELFRAKARGKHW